MWRQRIGKLATAEPRTGSPSALAFLENGTASPFCTLHSLKRFQPVIAAQPSVEAQLAGRKAPRNAEH